MNVDTNFFCFKHNGKHSVIFYFTEVFHPMDLAKINNSDSWLKRFLIHTEGNQEEALSMLWNVCEWRKSFGVNGNIIKYITRF